jgi:chromosome segregation ATPase
LFAPLRLIWVIAVLGTLAACGRGDAPPAEKAVSSLASAREEMDKARSAIEATEQHSKLLQQKIAAQRAELADVVERRATLLRQQLKHDEERLRRLPAAQESDAGPKLAAAGKQLDDVVAKLGGYRDAPPEKAAEALAALEKSLAAYADARRELETRLQPPS